MLTSHRTRYRTRRIGVSALLTLSLAAGIGILALSSDRTEATGPPPGYTLYTAVNNQQAGSIDPSGGSYTSGTILSVEAVPNTGWEFDHWEGELSGTANPTNLVMSEDRAIVAYFIPAGHYTLTASSSNVLQGTVSPAWSAHAPSSQAEVTATAANDYRFSHWIGSPFFYSEDNPASVSMTSDRTVTAYFLPTRDLTTGVVGQGSVDPSSGTYDQGAQVTVTATPASGWRFSHWTGSASGSTNPLTLTMNGHKHVIANFIEIWSLSTTVIGDGTVTPSAGTYDDGAPVTLTATPAQGWWFDSWSGDATGSANPVQIIMDDHKSVTAKFLTNFTLSMSVWREGSVDPGVGDHPYVSGTNVQVTATPAADTHFDHWEGDVPVGEDPEDPTITVPMDDDKSLMAVFVREMDLTTSVIGQGSVNPSSGTYNQYDQVVVTATPATNWLFRGWHGDIESTENSVTITMDAPMHLVAEFVEAESLAGSTPMSDLAEFLALRGHIEDVWDIADSDFDQGGAGNGIPDIGEFLLLQEILNTATFNRTPQGGTGRQTVYADWAHNLAQAATDVPAASAGCQGAVAGYMTLGTPGHVAFIVAEVLAQWSVTLDPSDYESTPGLGPEDDADGDRVWNRLEWMQVIEEYQIVDPDLTDAGVYADWAMDPNLPEDEDIDIGLDLPDGDGTDWDYSHLPQGTVTFQSALDLPIEIRILDPPGREDVPVTIGEPVDIPLGAELLITLAEGANPDWFYTWDADGQMINGSAERTERFRLMRGGTIQPVRRGIRTRTLPLGSATYEWSGVGPYGHLVEPGSGSGGTQVGVPTGAFLRLRAYRITESPGGGAKSTAGDDKEYAEEWRYEHLEETSYAYGSPAFNFSVVDALLAPGFNAAAPYGWWTHTATSSGGGYVGVGEEEGAGVFFDDEHNGGIFQSVKVPALAPGSNPTQRIQFVAFADVGYELFQWDIEGISPIPSRRTFGGRHY